VEWDIIIQLLVDHILEMVVVMVDLVVVVLQVEEEAVAVVLAATLVMVEMVHITAAILDILRNLVILVLVVEAVAVPLTGVVMEIKVVEHGIWGKDLMDKVVEAQVEVQVMDIKDQILAVVLLMFLNLMVVVEEVVYGVVEQVVVVEL
jgi:hypothetical protein